MAPRGVTGADIAVVTVVDRTYSIAHLIHADGEQTRRLQIGTERKHSLNVTDIFSTYRMLKHWKRIGASDVVQIWIAVGVKIPFVTLPEGFELYTHWFSAVQKEFIDNKVNRLHDFNFIKVCERKPVCVGPLGYLPKRKGKFRLITNLRVHEAHCASPKYKDEDIRNAASLLNPGDKLISLDIKYGFYHTSVCPSERDFLDFRLGNAYYRLYHLDLVVPLTFLQNSSDQCCDT